MTGSPDRNEQLLDEALAWQQRLADDDADWDGFTSWLESDPRHRDIFDEISLIERRVEDRREELRSIVRPSDERGGARFPERRRLLIGTAAAALALGIAVPTLWPGPSDTVYATGLRETRQIALAGGTAIDLAPSSKLIVDGADPNALRLERGEAFFAVRHDPQRRLAISAGGYTISDIGTKFAVSLGGDAVRMGVAEGKVTIAADSGAATPVSAGEQLIAMADGVARKSVVAIQDIGSWRGGRLVYSDTPLSIVVTDIARYSGQKIVIEPKLRQRRFSGVLTVGDGSKLLANLAELMALEWHKEGDLLRISARRPR